MKGDSVLNADAVRDVHVQTGSFGTHCLLAGNLENPPLVLLHDGAWGGSARVSWGHLIEQFAEDYYVIAPDLLGFGESDKAIFFDRSTYSFRIDQVAALLEQLGESRPINLVGTSFGGSMALRILAEGSFNLRRVVSIAGTGGPWKTPAMLETLGFWDGSRKDLARVLGNLMDSTSPDFEDQLDLRLASASTVGHYRAVQAISVSLPAPLRQTVKDDWPEALGQSATCPVMLVAPNDDTLFEPEWPDRIAAQLSDCAISRIDSLHSPNLDAPSELLDRIRQFLNS